MTPIPFRDDKSNKPMNEDSSLTSAVEALIFAAEEAITASEMADAFAEATGDVRPDESSILETVEALNQEFNEHGRAFRIEKWGGGFRFATLSELAPFLKALFASDKQRKLSRTLMESLAILAYRQPTTKSELEFVRGVDCDYAVRKLLEYGLIDVVGRSDRVGRPLLYGTTERFLELFGLSELSDLPNLRELESILDDPAFQKEKARLLMTTAVQLPLSAEQATKQSEAPQNSEPDDSTLTETEGVGDAQSED